MEPHEVILIPTKNKTFVEPKTDKQRVIVYSRVIKNTGAGVQIRKKVRRLIAYRPDWELLYVITDLCGTPIQKPKEKQFIDVLNGVLSNEMEILIIYCEEMTDENICHLEMSYEICKSKNVCLYIANNDGLISAEIFTNTFEKNRKRNISFKRVIIKHHKNRNTDDY